MECKTLIGKHVKNVSGRRFFLRGGGIQGFFLNFPQQANKVLFRDYTYLQGFPPWNWTLPGFFAKTRGFQPTYAGFLTGFQPTYAGFFCHFFGPGNPLKNP